jgi:hypothetical protein
MRLSMRNSAGVKQQETTQKNWCANQDLIQVPPKLQISANLLNKISQYAKEETTTAQTKSKFLHKTRHQDHYIIHCMSNTV